ncbi:hypothetical protein SPI_07859 [Niveomyces insectorum RCEF 264]|uniref:Uncharacterized protein n=1 Tax=Niveomyces insectorum RCEF 264 TaxID=1081102 RepID=A0A167P3F6_9HYPO|nr:hypothetical protein SPI_07859 [Niveomyces insectorum RCEF 264]
MTNSMIQTIVESGKRAGKYYDPPPNDVPSETRRLFEEYVGIAPDEVIPYLAEFRDALWDVYPWPCVGQFKFVSLTLHQQPSYDRIKAIVQNGGRYLDVGCAAGQDLRYLLHDSGASSANTFGLDRMGGYIDAAYKYFCDRDTLQTTFIVDDFLTTSPESAINALRGTVDVLHAGMFLHVFDLEGQHKACERLIELLAPRPGSLAVGNSVGCRTASNRIGPEGTIMFRHDDDSFRSMWDEVGRRTGTQWAVRTHNSEKVGLNGESTHWDDPTTTRLFWEVERR